jgi:hypothetical protein
MAKHHRKQKFSRQTIFLILGKVIPQQLELPKSDLLDVKKSVHKQSTYRFCSIIPNPISYMKIYANGN